MAEYIQKKSSGIATLLSFLWCGLGQIYNGKVFKGLIMMAIYFLFIALFLGYSLGAIGGAVGEGLHKGMTGVEGEVMTSETGGAMLLRGILFGIIAFVLWIYGMVNAHKVAEKINKGELNT